MPRRNAGITWLLSDVVVSMRPDIWATQYECLAFTALPPARAAVPPTPALREWLAHQKGLHRLREPPPPPSLSPGPHSHACSLGRGTLSIVFSVGPPLPSPIAVPLRSL